MKKILSLLLVFVLIFSVVACSQPAEKKEETTKEEVKNEESKATYPLRLRTLMRRVEKLN